MSAPFLSPQKTLTDKNIETINSIVKDVPPADRAALVIAACGMIYGQKFDSISAQWNAFHTVLRILTVGGMLTEQAKAPKSDGRCTTVHNDERCILPADHLGQCRGA